MTKVGRLRVMEYVEAPSAPLRPEDAIVRVEYFGAGNKTLGYVELFKVPSEKGNDYLARTEYGRWYVKVPQRRRRAGRARRAQRREVGLVRRGVGRRGPDVGVGGALGGRWCASGVPGFPRANQTTVAGGSSEVAGAAEARDQDVPLRRVMNAVAHP